MEVIGKIIHVLPPQSGTSQAGNQWKKQEYVLETEDAYPKKICFDFLSREYNGRWYTNIRGWKAEQVADQTMQQPAQPAPAYQQPAAAPAPAPTPDFLESDSSDDLPF